MRHQGQRLLVLSGAWLALCVAELTSGTRAGLMLSSPDKSFFAPVCAVMAARQTSPISVPHEAVFCTEVMLHSLGRGLAFLEQVPMWCSSNSSSWAPISSWSSGVFPPAGRVDAQPRQGLQDSGGTCWDWQPPPSSLRCREVSPVCPPLLPVCVTAK